MTPPTSSAQAPSPTLSIGDLARRTGVAAATLRMWEQRHGFPEAERAHGGHRRYREQTVDLVAQVLRRREAGLRLEAAIAEARASAPPDTEALSVFAEVRRRHPHLERHRLRKSTLLALSWALEDECCARAQRPVLFGAFQEERFYRPARPRWTELARIARSCVVMADFDGVPDPAAAGTERAPVRVHLAADTAMRREWSLVCDSPDLPAMLTAFELPGQDGVNDRDRLFEAVWSLDPRAVRDAARVCAHVTQEAGSAEAPALLYALADEPPATAFDPAGATMLFNRVVAYVDRLG